jgi:hypothetical protein
MAELYSAGQEDGVRALGKGFASERRASGGGWRGRI